MLASTVATRRVIACLSWATQKSLCSFLTYAQFDGNAALSRDNAMMSADDSVGSLRVYMLLRVFCLLRHHTNAFLYVFPYYFRGCLVCLCHSNFTGLSFDSDRYLTGFIYINSSIGI